MTTVLIHPRCTTCRNALKWLEKHGIHPASRSILDQPPTLEELSAWRTRTGQTVRQMFNTAGRSYRERNLKEQVGTRPESDLLALLAEDPMLVKRPVLVTDSAVCFGFVEERWRNVLFHP